MAFGVLAFSVAARMGVFSLTADVEAVSGTVRLPNTFASVDHPFHVTRADTLWRELTSGQSLRWVGQHQGGYPVEFYPLGEAGLEVLIRALAIGVIAAEGAHTLAVAAIFLLPGLAYAALARQDGWPLAVGFVAFALHVSLPGGWYHGGYTELVQWGLVTNVAGAVGAFLMLPLVIRFLRGGEGWAGAGAGGLAAWAVYCNPRSVIGLAALAAGAWVAVVLLGDERGRSGGRPLARSGDTSAVHPAGWKRWRRGSVGARTASVRLAVVVVLAALLAAPLLVPLARYGGLYTFVHYSGYDRVADYVAASVSAVSWPVLVLGMLGTVLGVASRHRVAATAAAVSLVVYVLLTATIAFVPLAARLAPQLEPTRLMPLQRMLTIYLAAVAVWVVLERVQAHFAGHRSWVAQAAAAVIAVSVLAVQTRPLAGPLLDPASPAVPPVSLFPVAMSAQPQQFDLEVAVRAADEAADPGTALLVLGSALSWHQQLWAPLWTARPLFYDNWLWYWQPDHAGTPGYRFASGHHYPDPERTLEPGYLETHGIGAVVVTGAARAAAAGSPLLELVRTGVYDAYAVLEPVTTVTFGDENADLLGVGNQRVDAVAEMPGEPIVARINWHPRWEARADSRPVPVRRLEGGYLAAEVGEPARTVELDYGVQPLDWLARLLALAGLVGVAWLVVWPHRHEPGRGGWYPRQPVAAATGRGGDGATEDDPVRVAEHVSP